MKRKLLVLFSFGLLFILMIPVIAEASLAKPKIIINGELQKYEQPAIIKDGRVLVPFRAIFEELGLSVTWMSADSSIRASSNSVDLYLKINSNKAIINGEYITLDVAPTIVNNHTFVPLRFVAESLGAEVSWNQKSGTAIIKHQNKRIIDQLNYNINYIDGAFPNNWGLTPVEGILFMDIRDEASYRILSNLSEDGLKRVLYDFYNENKVKLLGTSVVYMNVFVRDELYISASIRKPFRESEINYKFNIEWLKNNRF